MMHNPFGARGQTPREQTKLLNIIIIFIANLLPSSPFFVRGVAIQFIRDSVRIPYQF